MYIRGIKNNTLGNFDKIKQWLLSNQTKARVTRKVIGSW